MTFMLTAIGTRMNRTTMLVSLSLAVPAGILCTAPATVLAQAYPVKPIRFIIPQAGGQVDTLGRVVAQGMSERLGGDV
jgi:tripartite-type tricarboxylate transporter receptor subunit TctC